MHDRRLGLAAALALPLLTACAEVAPASGPDARAPADADAPSDTAPEPDAPPSDAAVVADAAPDGGPVAGLVINELRAAGGDWIELLNTGAGPLDLSGLRVADLDETTGGPKLAEAAILPAGLSLASGARLVVAADVAAPREGLQSDCLEGAVASCVEAVYGLSSSRGDRVFVVAAATDDVLLEAAYPAPAAAAVADGQTWARLPDGTGPFAPAAPTPGAPNASP
jgi:hypothetical protein